MGGRGEKKKRKTYKNISSWLHSIACQHLLLHNGLIEHNKKSRVIYIYCILKGVRALVVAEPCDI